ncbi:MAG: hypothetical protein ACXWUO_17670 [Allosphingosinicella sp.]
MSRSQQARNGAALPPWRPARLAIVVALAAVGEAAQATGTMPGQDGRLTPVLGGFVIVAAVIIVFMGVRRSGRRRRGDKGLFDAIDDFIEGDGGDGGGSEGDGD